MSCEGRAKAERTLRYESIGAEVLAENVQNVVILLIGQEFSI